MIRPPILPRERYSVMRRDNFKCFLCGRGVKDGVKLEVDHSTPVCRGGHGAKTNLRTLCFECNRGKGTKMDNEQKESTNPKIVSTPQAIDMFYTDEGALFWDYTNTTKEERTTRRANARKVYSVIMRIARYKDVTWREYEPLELTEIETAAKDHRVTPVELADGLKGLKLNNGYVTYRKGIPSYVIPDKQIPDGGSL